MARGTVDLSITHLEGVKRKAREILAAVAGGMHPHGLGGHTLRSSASTVVSVPVGLRYRLMFDAKTLDPISFLTHEQYNNHTRKKR